MRKLYGLLAALVLLFGIALAFTDRQAKTAADDEPKQVAASETELKAEPERKSGDKPDQLAALDQQTEEETSTQDPIVESWKIEWPDTDFTKMAISAAEVLSGGPPKDGIPAIDDPYAIFEAPTPCAHLI